MIVYIANYVTFSVNVVLLGKENLCCILRVPLIIWSENDSSDQTFPSVNVFTFMMKYIDLKVQRVIYWVFVSTFNNVNIITFVSIFFVTLNMVNTL